MNRSGILRTLGLTFMAALSANTWPQGYPNRSLTFVMPIAVGSAIETHIRILVTEAAKNLGQSIIVENRVGAGGKIGMQAMMAARNDGYTIGMTLNGIVVTQAIMDPTFSIRPGKDYVPVILTTSAPLVITANAGAPFKDLKGLISYARANPGKLNVGGASRGSNAHLGWEYLKLLTGTDFTLAIYQGEPAATTDLLNGLILALLSSATLKPHVESGKLIGLATTGNKSWGAFPTLPTVEDAAGLKGFNVAGLYGISAPAGVSSQAIGRLNAAFAAALADTEVQKKLRDFGIVPVGSTPEEYGSSIQSDIERWTPIIQKIGLKAG